MRLTEIELHEPMFVTWGRIRTKLGYSSYVNTLKDERLKALIDKFQNDLDNLIFTSGTSFLTSASSATCPTCKRELTDPLDIEAVEKLGECLDCDHIRGEIC